MQQDPDFFIARSAEELVGDLNPQQAEAVQNRGPALLIGAGAGYRQAHARSPGASRASSRDSEHRRARILAITFTNKAAR